MFSKPVLAVALPLLISSALAGDCVRHYTVKDGDTCDSISASESVSTYQLATINAGYIDEVCSNLQPGASICLGYENEDCTATYVVKANDTCDDIVDAKSTDLTNLFANNPQIDDDCTNIYIGEVLCVLPEIRVPPPPAGGPVKIIPPVDSLPANTGSSNTDNGDGDDDDSLPFCDEIDN